MVYVLNGQNSFVKPELNIPVNSELESIIEEYELLKKKYPNKKDLSFNLGNLKYYTQDFTSAEEEYRDALSSDNNLLKSQAHYNLGNTFYKNGKIENSLEHFKNSLKLNPNDNDARHNYEFVKNILQQKKQQDQQNKNNQDKEQQEKEQTQENQSENSQSKENENKDDSPQNKNSNSVEEENEKDQSDTKKNMKEDNKESKENSNENRENKEDENNQNMTPEQLLERNEAEAILNTLKATEQNLMKKKYKFGKPIKVAKDW